MRSTEVDGARFVFSGGAVHTRTSEAQMMADYAVARRVPLRHVVIEDQSRTTVENIVNSTTLLAGGSAVMIASDTFHARRARRIMHAESPELARRLVRARDYIPFEWGVLHVALVAFEAYRRRRARTTGT